MLCAQEGHWAGGAVGLGVHSALQLAARVRDVRPALLPVGLGGRMGAESAAGQAPRGGVWVPHAGSAGPPGAQRLLNE